MNLAFKIAFQKNTIYTALKVSIIVGLILNFINQGEALIMAQLGQINLTKGLLTFIVPYLVSTYSVTKVKLDFKIGEIAAVNADLSCQNCGKSKQKSVTGTKIPICPNCLEQTNWKIHKYR